MKRLTHFLLLLCLAGCTTPQQRRDQRISEAWHVFSTFSPDVQEQIRQGHVDVGFTQQMVRLALGSPDRTYSRKTEEGLSTIWSYSGSTSSTRYEYVTVPMWVRGECGDMYRTYEPVGVTVNDSHEYERIRIELKNGKVHAVERMQP